MQVLCCLAEGFRSRAEAGGVEEEDDALDGVAVGGVGAEGGEGVVAEFGVAGGVGQEEFQVVGVSVGWVGGGAVL